MPTANAEDPRRPERTLKTRLTEAFPTLPSDPIWPLGVRRRRAPKIRQKKNRPAPREHGAEHPLGRRARGDVAVRGQPREARQHERRVEQAEELFRSRPRL